MRRGCLMVVAAAATAAMNKADRGLSEFRQQIEAAIPPLRRYARALTRDAETADDIVQDTIERALRFMRVPGLAPGCGRAGVASGRFDPLGGVPA